MENARPAGHTTSERLYPVKKNLLFAAALSLIAGAASAEIVTEKVAYEIDGAPYEGVIAYDNSKEGKRPGVLIIHEWWGLNDYSIKRAKDIAALGYVGFAGDVYGKDKVTSNPEEAGKWAGALRNEDRVEFRKRTRAALEAFAKQPQVDADNVAAIGYCFGGTAVLELARGNAPVKGVVSFHGGLARGANDTTTGTITPKVLVLHGADDPMVPPAEVQAFQDEMRAAKADWYMVSYGNSVHGFTNPAAGNDHSKGMAYTESADKRSWEAMKDFLEEIFP